MDENSVTKDFLVTAADGKNYRTKHYNLDAIIAVGYRYTQPSERQRAKVPLLINTKRATAFRQWATAVLRDYALRGYVIDKKRMENGAFLDEDYFEHLLAEIREIRPSLQRNSPKVNLKNIALFKTACLNPILTGKLRRLRESGKRCKTSVAKWFLP